MVRRTLFIFLTLLSVTLISTTAAHAQAYCMSVSARLAVGAQGRVTPGLPNVIRVAPEQGPGNAILAYIPAGGVFTVLSGPACSGGITWWYVSYGSISGWTPEGQWSTYWTEPVSPTPPPTPTPITCTLPPRLVAGGYGRVTPGLPNRMRVDPSLNARFLRLIPAGGTFSVLSNGVCVDGMVWYQVNYAGAVGWTAEGLDNAYWLEPQ